LLIVSIFSCDAFPELAACRCMLRAIRYCMEAGSPAGQKRYPIFKGTNVVFRSDF